MKFRIALTITVIISCSVSISADDLLENLRPFEGKMVRHITLDRKNVFDDIILRNQAFYYKWANDLHIKTRENIITREFLFKSGHKLSLNDIIETERNIRLGEYIADIKIIPTAIEDDSVDLGVKTTDLWTTKVAPFFNAGGGNYYTGLLISEKNFLGRGLTIETFGQSGRDEDGFSIMYLDRRLFNSRLTTNMVFYDYTYSKYYTVLFSKPQYSLSVPAGYDISFTASDQRNRLFYEGNEYFRYGSKNNIFHSDFLYSYGKKERISLIAQYDYVDEDFRPLLADSMANEIIPGDEIKSYPSVGLGVSRIEYGVEEYLDEAGTPEDLTFGGNISAKAGYSGSALGADYEGARFSVGANFLAHPYDWLIAGASDDIYWWRRNHRNERVHHRTEFYLYGKIWQTHILAMRLKSDFAWRERQTYQLLLGGDNGLRGFEFNRFSGQKLALGNLEYRFYLPLEIFTVRIGGAAFFDIGNIWRQNQKIEFRDLRSDIGFGLRFGLTKSSSARVVRFDVSRSLSDNNLFVAVSSDLVFSLRNLNTGYAY